MEITEQLLKFVNNLVMIVTGPQVFCGALDYDNNIFSMNGGEIRTADIKQVFEIEAAPEVNSVRAVIWLVNWNPK